MILVYSQKLTNRLRYIFKTIFKDVLLVDVDFTENTEKFNSFDGVKINYSNTKLDSGIFCQPASILFETGINEQNISIFEFDGLKCFFSSGQESIFPFDLFAASFYLISRYEEYLPHRRDEHERFIASESLAYQHKFLHEPIVNQWIERLVQEIEKTYDNFKFPPRKFNYLSTLDVDNAYAFKNKGFIRLTGGLLKGIKEGSLSKRLGVLMKNEKDPYDTFDYQNRIHQKFNTKPTYFFLLGDYGLNDKNIPTTNSEFQSLIKSLSDYYSVGIHPSYKSNSNIDQLILEINRLKKITHRNTEKSRQHFLKLNLPYTYRNLIECDIKEDYTMGYAESSGFRASICTPFYFYDLDSELATNLKVVPFAVMEATYQYYLKKSPEESVEQIFEIMQKVKDVKGTFVSVWHNESLSDEGIWKGWKLVYEQMLEEATK